MKFPILYCVPTSFLTKETYEYLLTKLVSEGYHWPSQSDKSCFFDLWEYIGVNSYGDIHLYSESKNFLAVDSLEFNNVLTKEWLERYLKD